MGTGAVGLLKHKTAGNFATRNKSFIGAFGKRLRVEETGSPVVVCSSSASVFQPGIAEQEAFAKRPFDTATSSSSSMNDEEIGEKDSKDLLTNLFHSLPNNGGEESSYNHVMELSRWVVLGSIIGFVGAALGSIGGVGGIFVPMLPLIIGFDPKTSTAISKWKSTSMQMNNNFNLLLIVKRNSELSCMIMGAAGTTVYYNLRLRHPTMDLPIIDYDLALLFQPMIMLGISIGVALNIIFPDWMLTVFLIIHFLGSYKSLGLTKKWCRTGIQGTPWGSPANPQCRTSSDDELLIKDNIYWKELTVLSSVWAAFVAVQIVKTYTTRCSTEYWVLNIMQVPIVVAITINETICLCEGKRTIASRGNLETKRKIHQLLGFGGGLILEPLFLEMGVPRQVLFS
ncbi:sulfite exporter TauE/SafE family protein 3-like [Musa acuminata AAA Group]|uniref:sulfite exporter TauE/SafE family protein 3-like n=1 Tax=Musa acuminata AAA Group TaxID=214697 RepID=UPI0031E4130D